MDGILMKELHGNLHRLSEESWRLLKGYYGTGTLSSEARRKLLNEITKHKGTLKEPHSQD
jgi:hypothetical protein